MLATLAPPDGHLAGFEDLRRGLPSESSAAFLTGRGLAWADCGCGCSDESDESTGCGSLGGEWSRLGAADSLRSGGAAQLGSRAQWSIAPSRGVEGDAAVLAALRAHLAASRVSGGTGGSQAGATAAAQNAAISSLAAENGLSAPTDLSRSRVTDYRLDCPPSPSATSCPVSDAGTCLGPLIGQRSTVCSTDAFESGDHIRVLNLDSFHVDLAQTMRDLLKAAWCMILENPDAGIWATQLVQGPDRANFQAWCIANRRLDMYLLDEGDPEVNVFFTISGSALVGPMIMVGNTSSDVINNWASQWEHGDDAARLCIAVDVASILFHETTHGCGIYPIDLDPNGTCRDSYLIGNNFKLALLQRYPGAMDALCCQRAFSTTRAAGNRQLDLNHLFMSNGAISLTPSSCVTDPSSSSDTSSSEAADAYLYCLKHPTECNDPPSLEHHTYLGR